MPGSKLKKSCYGCGDEWYEKWNAAEVSKHKIDGIEYYCCPDCVAELIEQGILNYD